MIDSGVQAKLQSEIRSGETLLWASQTSTEAVEIYIDYVKQANSSRKLFAMIYGAIFIAGSYFITKDLTHFILGLLAYVIIYLGAVFFWARQIQAIQNFPIGGYALTNKRLLELDHDLNVRAAYDAANLEHVYEGAGGIVLKPVGKGLLKSYKLLLLKTDIYVAMNAIHATLRARRTE